LTSALSSRAIIPIMASTSAGMVDSLATRARRSFRAAYMSIFFLPSMS
jgi:hypothetical protein